MNRSSNAEHFFQTDSSISESTRKSTKSKNEAGNPIRLTSKLLAVAADPFDQGAVYVAEGAGTIKRIVLETKETTHSLRASANQPSPFTCLTIIQTSSTDGTLFAGSWDRNIYAWPISSSFPTSVPSTASLKGHTDFLKTLLAVPATSSTTDPLLVSGSADKSIIIWNARTHERLHTLLGHARAVLALALDPFSLPDVLSTAQDYPGAIIASGDSNREIRFWQVSAESAHEISYKAAAQLDPLIPFKEIGQEESDGILPLIVHETSIFALSYAENGDLWTASADRSTKQLSRQHEFSIDSTLEHGDYVKAVVIASETNGAVVTCCRDEDVRVWDGNSGQCRAVLKGHWDEVTGLAVIRSGKTVVSVGIDGTVRTWGLEERELKLAIETFERRENKEKTVKQSLMTEEEERELAELMDDDD